MEESLTALKEVPEDRPETDSIVSEKEPEGGPGTDSINSLRESEAGIMAFNKKPEGESRAALYSGLNLAYVGDAVFELYVRTFLLKKGNMPVNRLHKAAVSFVSASAQARMSEAVAPLLDEREMRIVRRGENAKPHSISKNADRVEHEKATGFEALIGYLYLKGDEKRLMEIIEAGMRSAERTDT